MKEQIASVLKGLGEVSVTSVTTAFEAAPELIARGTVKADATAIAAFKHSSLNFSFDGPSTGSGNIYSFNVFFHPSALASGSNDQEAPPEKTTKPAAK
jgi:hypothetical protein